MSLDASAVGAISAETASRSPLHSAPAQLFEAGEGAVHVLEVEGDLLLTFRNLDLDVRRAAESGEIDVEGIFVGIVVRDVQGSGTSAEGAGSTFTIVLPGGADASVPVPARVVGESDAPARTV